MAAERITEWDTTAWPEVEELFDYVNPSVVLAELKARRYRWAHSRARDVKFQVENVESNAVEELRALVTHHLPETGFAELQTFRKVVADLRTKLVNRDSNSSESVRFHSQTEGPTASRSRSSWKPSHPDELKPEHPSVPDVPLYLAAPAEGRFRLQRIEGSERSKKAAVAIRKKGDRALYEDQSKNQSPLYSTAKRMYLRALKLHPAQDSGLYKKAYESCVKLEDYSNAAAVCDFWIWDSPAESMSSVEAFDLKIKALKAGSLENHSDRLLKTLEEGYTMTHEQRFLYRWVVKARNPQGGMKKLQIVPRAEDVKEVVLKLAAKKKYDVIEALFLGDTTTTLEGSGGFAIDCKLPEFPLEEFIESTSCSPKLVERLLRSGAAPDGPPGNPPEKAWALQRDDILAVLIKHGAKLTQLMENLFGQINPDNMLHGAVKAALHSGDVDQLKRVMALAKTSGRLSEWECDRKGETIYTIASGRRKRKGCVLKTLQYLANYEPDLNPERTNNYGKSPSQLASSDNDYLEVLEAAIANYKKAHPSQCNSLNSVDSQEQAAVLHAGDSVRNVSGYSLPDPFVSTQKQSKSRDTTENAHDDVSQTALAMESTSEKEQEVLERPVGSYPHHGLVQDTDDTTHNASRSEIHDSRKDEQDHYTKAISEEILLLTDRASNDRETGNKRLAWEVECRQPVIKGLLDLRKTDRDKVLEVLGVIMRLGEGSSDKELMKTAFKNGVHIRAALAKELTLLWEQAIAYSSKRNMVSDRKEKDVSKLPRLYTEKIRIWNLAKQEDDCKTAVDEIRYSISSGRKCNPKFITRVKPCEAPQTEVACEDDDRRIQIPKLYAEAEEQVKSESRDCKEVSLPRSVNEDDCTTEKFYEFTSDVVNRIRGGDDCDASCFPFIVTHQEHDVIQAKCHQPILVHGRSGTGKTTCLIYRLWERYRKGTLRSDTGSRRQLRQMFVSKNPVFVKNVEKYFNSLCRGSGIIRTEAKGTSSLKQMDSREFPLFVTAREYFAMLEQATTAGGNAAETNYSSQLSKSEQSYYDEEKGMTVENFRADSKCDDSDWYQDDGFDPEIDTTDLDEAACDLDMDSGTWAAEGEVSYLTFHRDMWSQLVKNLKSRKSKTLHPSLVWKEIKSFIKGTVKSLFNKDGCLTENQYIEGIGRKQAPGYAGESRKEIYELSQIYKALLQTNRYGHFDECDRVRSLYSQLVKPAAGGLVPVPGAVDEIYIDEVQDFTQAEIAVMSLSCSRPQNMFLAGDTAQAVTKGISFRFEDLQQLFREIPANTNCPDPPYELTENYRSHTGILKLAASIVDILGRWFPLYFDCKLPKDEGRFDGPKPVFLESCSLSKMADVLQGSGRKDKYVEFGAYQAIIVRSGEARSNLPLELRQGLCLTVFEAKGLEFQDVLLFNFFKDSETTDRDWRLISNLMAKSQINREEEALLSSKLEERGANPRMLCSELKQLYTAVTRARRKVWVYDDDPAKREPIAAYFRNEKLIEEVKSPLSSLDLEFAEPSDESKWKERGKELEDEKRWDLAAECYQRAGDNAADGVRFCKAHSMVAKWRKSRERGKSQTDLAEAARVFASLQKHELAARVYCLAGNFMKAAEILDGVGKGEAAISLYRKARDKTDRGRTHVYGRVTDALLECCKKNHDWKLLINVLREEKKYEDAIEEVKEYNKLVASLPEKIHAAVKPPPMTIEDLAFEAACLYHETDSTDRFILFVKLLSGPSLQRFIQFLQQSGNFGAFGLLQKAGKLSLVDTAKLYYRFGKLEEAKFVSRHFKELRDREFGVHCRVSFLWKEIKDQSAENLSASAIGDSTTEVQLQQFQDLAQECSRDNLPDGEIESKYLLFCLTKTRSYLSEAYSLSVKYDNIIGQALSLHHLMSSEQPTSLGITEVLRTVKLMCTFCHKIMQSAGIARQKAKAEKTFERELRFLGVFCDSQISDTEDQFVWISSEVESIHLWELPGAHQLKSKCKTGSIECNKVLTVVGEAMIRMASDVMIGVDNPYEVGSGEDIRATGITEEVHRLFQVAWCPDSMVGTKCRHDCNHEEPTTKRLAAAMSTEFIKTLDRLIHTAKNWASEDKKHPLSRTRLTKLERSREISVRKVIDLCYPGFHCKLRGSENRAMIQWARRLDQETMRTLGNCTVQQWRNSFSSVDLFNVWRTHRLAAAGKKSERQFETWLRGEQKAFFRSRPPTQNSKEWLEAELSRSLVEFQGPVRGQLEHCFVLWLWIEFLTDVYWNRDFVPALQAIFYLVSFELRLDFDPSRHQQRADNILMLIEIGIAVALLIIARTGRAVVIPSPFVAGYMVLDAAMGSNDKRGKVRIEEAVRRCSWIPDMDIWARHFLSLAAAGIVQYKDEESREAAAAATSCFTHLIARQLVITLTLLCNSDKRSELRKRCSTILSSHFKVWLLSKAPGNVPSGGEIHSAREAVLCLREILLSYQPEQWIYQVDWSLEQPFPLRTIKSFLDCRRYSELLERHAIQGTSLKYQEYIPGRSQLELKTIFFPYLASLSLPQFWTIHAPEVRAREGLGSDKRLRNSTALDFAKRDRNGTYTAPLRLLLSRQRSSGGRNAEKKTVDSTALDFAKRAHDRNGTYTVPPRLQQSSGGRNAEKKTVEHSVAGNSNGARLYVKAAKVTTVSNVVPTMQTSTEESRKTNTTENGTADSEESQLMPTGDDDRELSLTIGSHEAHFSKWLQEGPYRIDSFGGEITSSRSDNHVVFPPGALGEERQPVNITYSQYCLNTPWEGDGCVLDLVQLRPHDVNFNKHVDICIRHHLMLNEFCEVCVMRSSVSGNRRTRTWLTIARLSSKDMGRIIQVDDDENTFVCLEDHFVTISSKHFCEHCVVVKGELRLAVQCFQLSPKAAADPNRFRAYLFLSCRSPQRMKRVVEFFPSDCNAERKAVEHIVVKTKERDSLKIKLTVSDAWKLVGENPDFDGYVVEYEELENHARNEHEPVKWDMYFKKDCPGTNDSFELQISFSSKGVHEKKAWVLGHDCTAAGREETPKLQVVPEEKTDNPDRQISLQDIRQLYLKVSAKWMDVARQLPGDDGSLSGLDDWEIDQIEKKRNNNNDRCYDALSRWWRKLQEKATVRQMVLLLINSDLTLEDVASKVFSAEVVRKCKEESA